MEQIKSMVASLVAWFNRLTKQQQLLTVGAVILLALITGRTLNNNGLDGFYDMGTSGFTGYLIIRGQTGEGSITNLEYGESVTVKLENIDVKTQTFRMSNSVNSNHVEVKFTKYDRVLTMYEEDEGNTLIFIKR